ncbi:hypothetical protein [Bradyrhizobium sp.]|uniref:hypothetical protein n=1 Tax=Bradyrhizobium sp. TaxID=376 RepID=UPI001ED2EB0F|nr:hypothetical protein [Bradyrhizobium sp.]MBV8891632.1 hypothetical protein [Acidobacteriota bacterium]MBV9483637.1 hypothetical protein [Acidobacteriota bacterium]MBV9978943.1 hypothetical protein [Bradyrhizobium sp.]
MKHADFSTLPRSHAEARKHGIDRFFTGQPCDYGHLAPRYVSTRNCSQCQLEHARKHGGWKARPSKEDFLQRVKEAIEKRGGTLLSEYVSARAKLKVHCERGHKFEVTPDNLNRGRWCRTCKYLAHSARQAANYRSVEWLREFARREHSGDCLATEPAAMHSKVPWKCSNAALFPGRIVNVVHQGNWCSGCDAERRRLHPPKPQIAREVVERIVAERGGQIVDVAEDGAWQGSKTYLTIRCADGHQWRASASNLVYAGSWCPECRNKGERIVRAIFEATFGAKFPKSRPTWLRSPKARNLELDGYSEHLQLAFEYQGPHHDQDANVKFYDQLKRDACSLRGIRLVEVLAVKRPFPTENVLEAVRRAFLQYGVNDAPIIPTVELFARELQALQRLARERGGRLLSTKYAGSEPHIWSCGKPHHDPWPAEAWRIRNGDWCSACAGNRPLGTEKLRAWGRQHGLELLDTDYCGTAGPYRWRCLAAGHDICRTKGNIEQSLRKQLPACTECAVHDLRSDIVRRDKADEFARNLMPVVNDIRAAGTTSLTGIADELNRRAIPTWQGRTWYVSTVKNLLARHC